MLAMYLNQPLLTIKVVALFSVNPVGHASFHLGSTYAMLTKILLKMR